MADHLLRDPAWLAVLFQAADDCAISGEQDLHVPAYQIQYLRQRIVDVHTQRQAAGDPAWLERAERWLCEVRDFKAGCKHCAEKADKLATLLAAVDTAAREKYGDMLVEMQRHRDAWRGYAYGRRERPRAYLDGDMLVDDQGPSIEERISAAEARGREAEREENCKAMCPDCAKGVDLEEAWRGDGVVTFMVHGEERRPCRAKPIRDRGRPTAPARRGDDDNLNDSSSELREALTLCVERFDYDSAPRHCAGCDAILMDENGEPPDADGHHDNCPRERARAALRILARREEG